MAEVPQLTSRRPYLLRAMHEWMTDNGQTPHLLVDATVDGVIVPRQRVQDGKIAFNVSYTATAGLMIKNDWVTFGARFDGKAFEVSFPVHAVLAIYSSESRDGIAFADEEAGAQAKAPPPKPGPDDEPRRPKLKLVT